MKRFLVAEKYLTMNLALKGVSKGKAVSCQSAFLFQFWQVIKVFIEIITL